jgi:hypothetical protein
VYHTCIHCLRDLGANDLIEALPIGRRMAFDPTRGRLWVVCRHCERWNLTPFEERWEALEECERLFRATRTRYSSANIGIARIREGFDLVRIGEPLRPEFAAWRYGDQFGRRRRRYLAMGAASLASTPLILLSVNAALGTGALAGCSYFIVSKVRDVIRANRSIARVPLANGSALRLTREQLEAVRIQPCSNSLGWRLNVPATSHAPTIGPWPDHHLEGEDATGGARILLPVLNRGGGTRKDIARAVGRLEECPDLTSWKAKIARDNLRRWIVVDDLLHHQPADVRLAFEMLLHEDLERRSLAGELHLLSKAWKEAEEVAGIADALLLPPVVEDQIGALRREG